MAVPSVVQSASNSASDSTSLTITLGAAPTVGNLMVAAITWYGAAGVDATAPAGWTLIRRTNTANYVAHATYYRVVQSGDGTAYAWTAGAAIGWSGNIIELSGVDTATPINVENGQISGVATPSVVPTVNDGLAFASYGAMNNAVLSATPAAGWTERADLYGVVSATFHMGTETQTRDTGTSNGVGVSGSVTWSAFLEAAAHIAVITPAGGAGGGATGWVSDQFQLRPRLQG